MLYESYMEHNLQDSCDFAAKLILSLTASDIPIRMHASLAQDIMARHIP